MLRNITSVVRDHAIIMDLDVKQKGYSDDNVII